MSIPLHLHPHRSHLSDLVAPPNSSTSASLNHYPTWKADQEISYIPLGDLDYRHKAQTRSRYVRWTTHCQLSRVKLHPEAVHEERKERCEYR